MATHGGRSQPPKALIISALRERCFQTLPGSITIRGTSLPAVEFTYLKTPRFDGLVPASALASRIKAQVGRRDTTPEMLLRRELWRRGFRYRLHGKHIAGKPDLVFGRDRVVIFCDGDFWHGREWTQRRKRLASGANANYWIAKIESNMARDKRISAQLQSEGWLVIRIWESAIAADPLSAGSVIAKAVRRRRSQRARVTRPSARA